MAINNFQSGAAGYTSTSASVFPQFASPQQLFPQPQGNVYFINNSLEVANIPMSGGISIAICMSEGLMYLKSLQNGSPIFMAYSFSPYENKSSSSTSQTQAAPTLMETIQLLENRVKVLEDKSSKKGGNLNELL